MNGSTGTEFSTDISLAMLSPGTRLHEQARPGTALRRNAQPTAGAWLRCLPKGPCHASTD